ncbi:MAG TPA: TonB-dependent receptor, partial [Ignavibacteriaceae bacterium]|nr:TonB-dependent receptor [Ignavibacteriaceae bacterium]
NAIKSITLTKGGFPARYGGRLSSVLDITMKDGNKENYQVEGGVGLLSANLTIQGPIEKGKSSFIISGRRSYFDLLSKPFFKNGIHGINYFFYDFNGKLNYEIGKTDHLFISHFSGKDNAIYTGASSLNFNIDFGNTTNTIRWNHLFGSKLFSNTSFIINDYHLGLATSQGNYYSLLYTGIKDITGKSDFTYVPAPGHQILTGFNYTYHTLFPGAVSAKIPTSGSRFDINRDSIQKKYSNEFAFYISDDIKMNEILSADYGIRIPVFKAPGKTYSFIEPRITVKLSLNKTTSLKASFTEMNQFVHLVPSSTASFPTDIWLTSSSKVRPQHSTQFAIGFFKNFSDNNIETSAELYYKTMDNQVLFKEGTQFTLTTNLEDVLTFGKGKSYGIELFVRKNSGRLTGWISYTLSKTSEKFPDLNYGKVFPFTYDRRHNLSVTSIYRLSKHWVFSADFTFYSGIAFTLPGGKFFVPDDGSLYDGLYYDYTTRNNSRLRSYNRLDINFSNRKKGMIFNKNYERELSFGIYNLYSRQNPYFVYLTTDPVTKVTRARQVSLLPVIPSISYSFKF